MAIVRINKQVYEWEEYLAEFDIDIPVRGEGEITGEDFMEEMLINQCKRGLKLSRDSYKESELPDIFIKEQKYLITNGLPDGILGMYNPVTDQVCFDADTISDIKKVEAAYIHGHEIGHKIIRYKNMELCFKDIAEILSISPLGNDYCLNELFCDECGNIVANTNNDRLLFGASIPKTLRKQIQRKILYHIYR